MEGVFYNFSKRHNSTKLPNDAPQTQLMLELKSATNIYNPTFIIKSMPANFYPIWTYCFVPKFQRLYFINNWTWLNGVWECSCICDVLASFRSEIGNLEEYIYRSSADYDGSIVDVMYPTTCNIETNQTPITNFFVNSLSGGFYVLGIISRESTASQGAITYYQMTPSQLSVFKSFLMSDFFLRNAGLDQLADFVPADAVKVIYNPYQYIASCTWYPFPDTAIPAEFKTSTTTVTFGWWDTGTASYPCYRLNANLPIYTDNRRFSIPWHPDSATRGDYLNHSPFTQRILRIPPFDDIVIPDEYFTYANFNDIDIEIQCDFLTGIGYMNVYSYEYGQGRTFLCARVSQKLGVDIQLAQIGTDYLGAKTVEYKAALNYVNSAAQAITSVDWMHPISSSIQGGMDLATATMDYKYGYLEDYMKSSAPQLLTSGANGSLAAYKQTAYLQTTFYRPVTEDNTHLGRPLCDIRTIKDLPGYMVILNPDVDIDCFAVEKQMITSFLQKGFFYE